MDCYGVQHALVVGPNSGYSTDSRPVFDAIARSNGRCKGISVVRLDIGTKELADLKAKGIVGIAFNSTLDGVEYYLGAHDMLARLADLDMILQIRPKKINWPNSTGCLRTPRYGSPSTIAGGRISAPGSARQGSRRCSIWAARDARVSNFRATPSSRASRIPTRTCGRSQALLDAFTTEGCVWASDWPFVKATERIDYGPLLKLFESLVPDPADRPEEVMWIRRRRWFGFPAGRRSAASR